MPQTVFSLGFHPSWPPGRWTPGGACWSGYALAPVVLHLHHLTPLHDAAESVWPDVPVVTHLHGTELLMLDQIEQYSGGNSEGSRIGLPASWRYGGYWADRLRATAQRSRRILAASTDHAVARSAS